MKSFRSCELMRLWFIRFSRRNLVPTQRSARGEHGSSLKTWCLLGIAAVVLHAGVSTRLSEPVGSQVLTLNGAVNGVPKINTFSMAYRLPIGAAFVGRRSGTITGVTANTLTDVTAGWIPGALSETGAPYFIQIQSGAGAGTWWQIASSTESTLLIPANRGIDPLAAGIAPGDAYVVVPADTLATYFGAVQNTLGGTSASTADAVRVHDGVQWREYWFNTSANQWREGSATFNRNNTVLRPDAGVIFLRRAASPIVLRVCGKPGFSLERVAVGSSGVSFVVNPFPVARTLVSFKIQDCPGFVKNTGNLTEADKVSVFDGVAWREFNYNATAGQWREGTATFNRNSFVVPRGTPLQFTRGASDGSAYWLILSAPI